MKFKKKILFAGHSSEVLGGAEDEFQKLLEYLSEYTDIFEVDAIFPVGERVNEFAKYCKRFQTYERCFLPASKRHILEYYGYLKSYFRQKKMINNFINMVNYDICLINSSVMLWFVKVLKRRNIKLIIFVRETMKPDLLRKILYKYYSRSANFLIFANNRNRYEYKEISRKNNAVTLYYSIRDKRSLSGIDSLRKSVDDEFYKMLNNKGVFKLMISGFVYEVKNQIMAVKVLREMRARNYKLPVIIIKGDISGDEKYYKKIRNLINDYNLNEYFYFVGYIKKDEYYQLFNMIDALLITSLEEGCPLVLFEAMKFKKTVISTKVGGVEDLIKDNINGFIAINENDMAEKINIIMKNHELKKTFEMNANKLYIENFSDNKVYDEYIEIINKVIESQ